MHNSLLKDYIGLLRDILSSQLEYANGYVVKCFARHVWSIDCFHNDDKPAIPARMMLR